MRAGCILILALAFSASPSATTAQTSPQQPRPKIGLALGGGMARGIAYIGVLEWLEDHHVPIDLIAGTSAGGLVGGAYAAGMTPSELRGLVASVDWDSMFQSDVPHTLKDFRRKEDARDFPARLEFGLRRGFRAPSSLGASEQVDLLLSRVALRYFNLRSFDELPIPFRCVATDLVAEEAVVLGDGPLAQALRATMAYPGLFSPVRRGNRVLVDGGVLNNVPADVVRAMGADVVIAVDVGGMTPLEPGLDSAITLMKRTLDVLTDRNARVALQAADIVFKPDLKDMTATDWRRSAEIADLGYRAAGSVPGLAALSVDDHTWSAYLAQRNAKRVLVDPVPVSLTITGVPLEEQATLRARLARHLGHPLDPTRLGIDLTAVAGSSRYDTVTYQLFQRPEGVELAIAATPKSYGPPFLRFGIDVTSASSSVFQMGVRGRLTAFDVAGYRSEARLDAEVGTGLRLNVELYKPIVGTRLFVAPAALIQRSTQDVSVDVLRLVNRRANRAAIGADIGLSVNRSHEIRLGFSYGHATMRMEPASPTPRTFTGTERVARVQYVYDGQDAVVVPSRGLRLQASVQRMFRGMEPEDAAIPGLRPAPRSLGEVVSSAFVPIRTDHRVMVAFSAGTSFDARADSAYDFELGGPLRLGAYGVGEFRGRHYVLATAAYLHHLGRVPGVLGGPIYLAGAVEAGDTFAEWRRSRLRTVFSTGVVMDTLVGPVNLMGSVAADGHHRLCVVVGRAFR